MLKSERLEQRRHQILANWLPVSQKLCSTYNCETSVIKLFEMVKNEQKKKNNPEKWWLYMIVRFVIHKCWQQPPVRLQTGCLSCLFLAGRPLASPANTHSDSIHPSSTDSFCEASQREILCCDLYFLPLFPAVWTVNSVNSLKWGKKMWGAWRRRGAAEKRHGLVKL